MKTKMNLTLITVCVSSFLAASSLPSQADAPATAEKTGKTATGTVASVDTKEKTVKVKNLFSSRTYHLGDNCQFLLSDKKHATTADLRPGQKVTVHYTDASGVLVADRIAQEELRFRGTVRAFDRQSRTLTVKDLASSKTFQVPQNCKTVIRDGKNGALDDVKIGHNVTVIYETPTDGLVAREIEQKDLTYTGSLSAIDSTDRTIKAGQMIGNKKFNLADGCAIVIDGKVGAELSDLKLGDKCTLNYEDINGVFVVNRIERQPEPSRAETATSKR